MPRFRVRITRLDHGYIDVEADDEAQARERARSVASRAAGPRYGRDAPDCAFPPCVAAGPVMRLDR